VGEATWRVTRRRWWWGPRVVWTPLCGLPLVAKRTLQLASQQAHALGHGEVRPEHLLRRDRPLLAGLEVDLGRLQEAIATELRGIPR